MFHMLFVQPCVHNVFNKSQKHVKVNYARGFPNVFLDENTLLWNCQADKNLSYSAKEIKKCYLNEK